jgi:hypothetical protein
MAHRHVRVEGTRPIVIGVDPHKGSHTAAALDARSRFVAQVRVSAPRDG